MILERVTQPFAAATRRRQIGLRQQHAELIAADAGEQVGLTQRQAQHQRDLRQHPVAGLAPVA